MVDISEKGLRVKLYFYHAILMQPPPVFFIDIWGTHKTKKKHIDIWCSCKKCIDDTGDIILRLPFDATIDLW